MANPFYSGPGEMDRASGLPGTFAATDQGRSPFRKDFGRLLHAPSFRRLQGKTQLFPGAESDFFRNRLTHSLEVAQIARGIAARLNATEVSQHFEGGEISEDLVEFAAIAHDLGHPPFGHNGELALDELMRDYGGFEGNAQTLRILAAVEQKLSPGPDDSLISGYGLDLTFRSMASVLKYDNLIPSVRTKSAKLAKGYYASEVNLIQNIKSRVAPQFPLDEKFKTIECAIMDIADDIAYSTYDLEDALHADFVTPMRLASCLTDPTIEGEVRRKTNKALAEGGYKHIEDKQELFDVISTVFEIPIPETVKEAPDQNGNTSAEAALKIGLEAWNLDRLLVEDAAFRTRFTANRVGKLIRAIEFVPNRDFPALSVVKMRREEMLQVEVMKHLNYEVVIRSPRLAVVEHRGKELVARIYKALVETDGTLFPRDWRDRYVKAKQSGVSHARRVVCDYVACMTDRYAVELHARLYGEGASIFKPL